MDRPNNYLLLKGILTILELLEIPCFQGYLTGGRKEKQLIMYIGLCIYFVYSCMRIQIIHI